MNCHIKRDLSLFSSIIHRERLSEHEHSKLDKYYLIHWSGEYFESQLSTDYTITHQGITYVAIFTFKHSYFMPCHSDQVALSFRKPKPETGLPPICLIRII